MSVARSLVFAVGVGLSGCAGPAATQVKEEASGPLSTPVDAQARAAELLQGETARQGNVWIRCQPQEASIFLDGVYQGTCGMLAKAGRGLTVADRELHHLEVKQHGFHPYETYIAPGGARATMEVTLKPLAAEEKAP